MSAPRPAIDRWVSVDALPTSTVITVTTASNDEEGILSAPSFCGGDVGEAPRSRSQLTSGSAIAKTSTAAAVSATDRHREIDSVNLRRPMCSGQ